MNKYFKKETLTNPIYDASGSQIKFEPVVNNAGVLSLEVGSNDALIALLADKASKRRGGVVVISAEIYESLKKKEPALTPLRSPLMSHFGRDQGPRLAEQPNPFQRAAVPAVVENNPLVTDSKPPTRAAFVSKTRRASALPIVDAK